MSRVLFLGLVPALSLLASCSGTPDPRTVEGTLGYMAQAVEAGHIVQGVGVGEAGQEAAGAVVAALGDVALGVDGEAQVPGFVVNGPADLVAAGGGRADAGEGHIGDDAVGVDGE